ncbi:CLUMA_CG007535, isoform A [Clunio marinus]|uniref:CLUMA_CG007535, isoform A n=1 Tax=Clunio marinus TaxID=568069 RepID=A0A1J1I2L6_9DIPT|nr:CLUMA_CG007535, isoform A [Clunio marinus]
MTMLPALLDIVDEIYSNLDHQSKTSEHQIPLFFVPQRPGHVWGKGRKCGFGPMRECQRGQRVKKCGGVCDMNKPSEDFNQPTIGIYHDSMAIRGFVLKIQRSVNEMKSHYNLIK